MTIRSKYRFSWAVSFLNDRMGFGRNFTVTAEDYRGAVERGYDLLREMGYKHEDQFSVVSVQRRSIVERVA